MTTDAPSRWLAPIKINLFLHINGKISKGPFCGYHELQTYFQRLKYGDELAFECTCASSIHVEWREGDESISLKPDNEREDLIYRAATLLQKTAVTQGHPPYGVQITLIKNTPVGGGLGGGSSAAATTLIALNQLWGYHLPLNVLTRLATRLGADVPFFLHETNAWAEGIGDQITPYPSPVDEKWFLIVVPKARAITAQGYAHPNLIRNEAKQDPIELIGQWQTGYNAFEAVVLAEHPTLAVGDKALRNAAGFSRMTGSGACLFAPVDSEECAHQAAATIMREPSEIQRIIIAQALPNSPVADKK